MTAVQLEFSRHRAPDGRSVVGLHGELDLSTAAEAYAYIRDTIDRSDMPVTIDVAGLAFCGAEGLGVLARAADYARREGHPLRMTSVRPPLRRIIRITGLDHEYPELAAGEARTWG